MSTQELKFIDVEVEFPKETIVALDELAKSLGRSRDDVIREAVRRFVASLEDASGTRHRAAKAPTGQ
jgi:metal-responsive CopG/Arc/MetJ family transcriptional regulator